MEDDNIVMEEAEADEASPQDAYQDLLNRYQRSLAEFDNYRKRTLKEKSTAYDDGIRDTVEKLLPVLDNFERALTNAPTEDSQFAQGIVMIARQLETAIADFGVEKLNKIEGEDFDPKLHYAVAHVQDNAYEPNTIVEVLQNGYIHKGKVIRPSMVKVAN